MEGEEIEYDENGNPINIKKEIGPIAPLDHSQIDYPGTLQIVSSWLILNRV